MYNNKKIGFSFSGGSSRSSAHIGIIQALNENNIKADYISGTSGGAIIGALYAAKTPMSKMIEFAGKGKLSRIYKAELPIKGLTDLDYLGKLLTEYIDAKEFKELALPLFVTASNLVTGKKEVLSKGDLNSAVMASCAVPMAFKPVTINENVYADGGIFDNLPVEPLLPHCDVIIGMNVMPISTMPSKELDDMFTIIKRVLDMTMAYNSTKNFPLCDIIIEPKKVAKYSLLDFDSSEELFEIGYEAGLNKVAEIKALLNK